MGPKARTIVWVVCALALIPVAAQAQGGKDAKKAPDTYDELYARYLQQARTAAAPAAGMDIGWMASLASDQRARRVNDLVTIRVIESIAAVGSADSSLDKSSSAGASVTKLFGAESKFPGWLDPTSLASTSADTQFKGGGTTTRTGELSAIVTARVVEVLPNGDLVLEGAREIDINGDRQVIVLTGVVRTADVMPGNVALSTAVGHLRIRYFGRGLIKDNLQPGWLIRVINKIF